MIWDRIARRWRWWQLRRAGADVAYDVQTFAAFFAGDARGFKCGRSAYFSAGSRVIVGTREDGPGQLLIGDRLFVNHYAIIDCHYRITIGNHVLIGPHVYVCDFDHDIRLDEDASIRKPASFAPVWIADHVWLGAGARILKGVTIGEGAVVGAGGVVTRNVPACTVVVGNPARVLKTRFS